MRGMRGVLIEWNSYGGPGRGGPTAAAAKEYEERLAREEANAKEEGGGIYETKKNSPKSILLADNTRGLITTIQTKPGQSLLQYRIILIHPIISSSVHTAFYVTP